MCREPCASSAPRIKVVLRSLASPRQSRHIIFVSRLNQQRHSVEPADGRAEKSSAVQGDVVRYNSHPGTPGTCKRPILRVQQFISCILYFLFAVAGVFYTQASVNAVSHLGSVPPQTSASSYCWATLEDEKTRVKRNCALCIGVQEELETFLSTLWASVLRYAGRSALVFRHDF